MQKIITILLITTIVFSCNNRKETGENDVYYTCSMDPQVVEQKPGNCPICKMPLTSVKKNQMQNKNELQLSDQQIQLGNITWDSIRTQTLGEELLLNATASVNQNLTKTISARVMGRIDKLYLKNTGEIVSKGQAVYQLYSEELNIAIKELLLSNEKKKLLKNENADIVRIINLTKRKLELFGLTENQIKEIEKNNNPSPTIDILSPASGIITSVDISEGNYIMPGRDILHLAEFSTLWIEAQVYPEDMKRISNGSSATIRFPALPGRNYSGKISFVNPELNPSSKINIIRVEIENRDNILTPGMQAYVLVFTNEISALALPTDAIILDEKGATVWIKTKENTFKSRMVETGIESNGFTEIKKGISKNDIVVITGTYLLNSEYTFKKGSTPMEEHQH